jgi:hypothetical protein
LLLADAMAMPEPATAVGRHFNSLAFGDGAGDEDHALALRSAPLRLVATA